MPPTWGDPTRLQDHPSRVNKTDHIDLLQLHEILRFDDPDRIFNAGGQTAMAIQAWIDAHPKEISIIEMERRQDRIAREKARIASRKERRNVGEQTVFEALSEGDVGEEPFLFLSRRTSSSIQDSTFPGQKWV